MKRSLEEGKGHFASEKWTFTTLLSWPEHWLVVCRVGLALSG